MSSINRRKFIQKTLAAGAAMSLTSKGWSDSMDYKPLGDRKIFIFSKHLQFLKYPEMAKAAKEIGFDGVDLTVRPWGHVLPENVEKDLPGAVKAVRKEGLIIDTLTTGFNHVKDPITERTIKTAAKLGIKQYRMQWIKYDQSLDMEANLGKIKTQLSELAEMNAHYKIRGDYQNHSGTSFGSPIWDLWFVLRELDSKWLGCRYDIRHGTVEGIKAWPVSLKTIAPYIRSLDIKDFYWDKEQGDKLINCPLGDGLVNFEKYIQLLKEFKVKGNFTLYFEYPLGGANHGKYEISVSPKVVINAMKKDLKLLKGYLNS